MGYGLWAMGKKGFRDLVVWQKAKDLAVIIYQLSNQAPLSKDFSLRDQIRRSAVSIASNIAEGDERDTDKEAVRFLFIAKGSLAELRTQLEIAFEIGSLQEDNYIELEGRCAELGKMIGRLIKVRQATYSL
jgi:four helix bundle protein